MKRVVRKSIRDEPAFKVLAEEKRAAWQTEDMGDIWWFEGATPDEVEAAVAVTPHGWNHTPFLGESRSPGLLRQNDGPTVKHFVKVAKEFGAKLKGYATDRVTMEHQEIMVDGLQCHPAWADAIRKALMRSAKAGPDRDETRDGVHTFWWD